jgi:hypothetical protein
VLSWQLGNERHVHDLDSQLVEVGENPGKG